MLDLQNFITFFFTEKDIDTILTLLKTENIVQKKTKEISKSVMFYFTLYENIKFMKVAYSS